MYGEERSSMGMIGRAIVLASACAGLALAQPTITSLQASRVLSLGFPQNVTSITSGLDFASEGGFLLYVNGSFVVGQPPTVTWTNPASPSQSGTLEIQGNPSATQIIALVPNTFFVPQVAADQPVSITVTQNFVTSNIATFLIVPPPSQPPSPLPPATVGVSYSARLVKGGTAPFSPSSISGIPPGLQLSNSEDSIDGIPLGPPGSSNIVGVMFDFWNASTPFNLVLQVQGVPSVGPVQSSAGITYPYGTLTNLSSKVTGPTAPQPTGTVSMLDNGIPLVFGTLDGTGLANVIGVLLGTGTHPFVAHYNGDASYVTGDSTTSIITVTKATPTASLTGNPFTGTFGGTMSSGKITVIGANPPAAAPTGTITLMSGAVQLGVFTVNPTGTNITGVTLPTSLAPGVHALTFIYSGDSNYLGGNLPASVGIQQGTASISLNAKTNPIIVGQTETFTANVTAPAGFPAATGTVLFSDGSLPISPAINLINGVATFNTSNLSIGQHNISAFYTGDQNYIPISSEGLTVTVNANLLAFTTNFLPVGTVLQPYSTTPGVTGGVPPYTFSVTGLPAPLTFDTHTGTISGTPQSAGTFGVTIVVTDSLNVKATLGTNLLINPPPVPPVQISTPGTLPSGTVGVGYSTTIGVASGGAATYSIVGGNLPPGLSFVSAGNGALVTGTPTTAGTYTFTVKAVDAQNTSDTRDFTLTIKPPALSVGGSATVTGTVGVPLTASFGCTGGVPPYTTSITGSLPPGVSFANCGISGTPTQAGTFGIHLQLTDAAGTSVGKDISITINPPTLALAGGALPDGQVGVTYKATVAATGGIAPITYSASGLPDGLSMSSGGDITGTPTTAGQYSVRVTAIDSSKVTASTGVSATYTIKIAPVTLTFGAANLPDGVVGVAYSGSVSATGGTPQYSFTASGLPDGLSMSAGGAVSGTPTTAGTFTVNVTVTDTAGGTARATYSIKITNPPPQLTTPTAPNGTVGSPYSATFTAINGTPPYTFTATGQPSTLTMSASGTLSGTPTAPASFNLTVTVKDASGVTATKSYPVTIGLPATPPLNIAGINLTVNPAQQPRVSVSLASTYPGDVLVTLTLSVKPDSGPADPAVQFATGGTTATLTIPAGSLNSSTDVALQTGTVAGTITVTAKLTAFGTDVTASPAPTSTTRVNAAAPVIVSATGTRTSTGFTISVIGYVTDREVTTANFTFNGTNLGTPSLPVNVDTLFAGWLGGNAPPSAAFGSQFTYTQPFTVNGNNNAVTSITLTLTNRVGTSNSATVNLN
jgi:hypothetical protein